MSRFLRARKLVRLPGTRRSIQGAAFRKRQELLPKIAEYDSRIKRIDKELHEMMKDYESIIFDARDLAKRKSGPDLWKSEARWQERMDGIDGKRARLERERKELKERLLEIGDVVDHYNLKSNYATSTKGRRARHINAVLGRPSLLLRRFRKKKQDGNK